MNGTATISSPPVYKGIVVNNVFVAIVSTPALQVATVDQPAAYDGTVLAPTPYQGTVQAPPPFRATAQGITIVYQSGSGTTYGAALLTYTVGILTQKQLYADSAATQLTHTLTYTYDGNGRLSGITTVPVSGPTIMRTFSYNGSGQLDQIINN